MDSTNKKDEKTPGASLHEAMYFASEKYDPAASENTYLHAEILTPSRSPKFPA